MSLYFSYCFLFVITFKSSFYSNKLYAKNTSIALLVSYFNWFSIKKIFRSPPQAQIQTFILYNYGSSTTLLFSVSVDFLSRIKM